MRDIVSDDDSISLEAKNTAAAVEETEAEGEEEIILADICEVVISLKCKQCQFLCNDKEVLAVHIKQTHSRAKKITGNNVKNVKKDVPVENGYRGRTPPLSSLGEEEERRRYDEDNEMPMNLTRRETSVPEESPCSLETESRQESPSPASTSDKHGDDSIPPESILDESVEDVFLCAECDIVFSSREMCCSHMHKVHGLKQFSADFIQEEIISKPPEESQSPKRGRRTKLPKQFTPDAGTIVPKKFRVTKDVFHMCTRCPVRFESIEVMKFHEQCHQSPQATSDFSRKGNKKSMAYGHDDYVKLEITPQKGFLCPVCESNGIEAQFFPKWGPCSWHLWKEHRIDCELYTCSVCKQFKSHLIARVKDHEQLHSTKASYKCKTCNKTFKQMKQLRCHEKYHKDNSTKLAPEADSRWYTPKECPICKRVLSDSKCLKKHISAVHNKLKPYVCNICGHTSARKAELQLHIRQHTGEKPYKCPLCPFQTGDHNSLRKHKLRHSDERPYVCSYCDYRCIQSCAFKKHILACHPGQEVVFVCQLCSHVSVNETLFAAHQKDHAEGRITDESLNESEESLDKRSPSPSSSINSDGKNGTASNYWSGDEDSLDIIDNGGVTIPASPPPTTNGLQSHEEKSSTLSQKEIYEVKHIQNSFRNSHVLAGGGKITNETMLSKPQASPSVPNTPLSLREALLICANNSRTMSLQDRQHFLVPQSFSVPSQSLASPRHEKASFLVSNGSTSTSTNEDTESSTSEVITNPHQLIQNIQLTPLDLTDIILCNEQSNDDGMLQRLLDMSGV